MRRQSSSLSASPEKSILQVPKMNSTPTKNSENKKNTSMNSINFDTTASFPEPPSLNTEFEKLKANSRRDEKRVNKKRTNGKSLPGLEEVSKSEKRVSNQVLAGIPKKKINENSTDSSTSSSYLKQAGNYVSGLLSSKK